MRGISLSGFLSIGKRDEGPAARQDTALGCPSQSVWASPPTHAQGTEAPDAGEGVVKGCTVGAQQGPAWKLSVLPRDQSSGSS